VTDLARMGGGVNRAVKFVLIGVPSALVLTASVVVVTLFFFASWVTLPRAVLALCGVCAGGLGVLEAVGKRGEWLLLLPFIVAPFLLLGVLSGSAALGLREPELVAGVVTVVALVCISRWIARSYERRRGNRADNSV
jgi:phosphatidylglycerophosphate synthase